MANPKECDWSLIKRVARYIIGSPRTVQTFKWQCMPTMATTFTDSDWAGDKDNRKSTSGGIIYLGVMQSRLGAQPSK